ncbi:MAG: hypothetical protein K8W52_30125 [Deltaproteobacteria bacterium]|nr:hypothetical protein [Deltaproteobacteria bacterium]
MRILGATAVLSLVVHGAALAWITISVEPTLAIAPASEAAPPEEAIAPPPEELTIVELLPEPSPRDPGATVVRIRGAPDARVTASRATRAETAATATAHPEVAPAAPPPGAEAPHVTHLTMRGPEVIPLAEQLAAAALAQPQTYVLPDYPGLRTEVALAAARHRLRGGDMTALGEVVALEDAHHAEELRPQRDGTHVADKTTFVATVAADGTVTIRDKPNLQVHGLGATFDATDWAMRSVGQDPYGSAKLAFLDRTRDQRVEIGKAYQRAQLARSTALMQANLDRLWATTPGLAARKQAIFELWDECLETGTTEQIDGGTQARAQLARFVQTRLTGGDAFTIEELAHLNAHRRSRARFAPYAR